MKNNEIIAALKEELPDSMGNIDENDCEEVCVISSTFYHEEIETALKFAKAHNLALGIRSINELPQLTFVDPAEQF